MSGTSGCEPTGCACKALTIISGGKRTITPRPKRTNDLANRRVGNRKLPLLPVERSIIVSRSKKLRSVRTKVPFHIILDTCGDEPHFGRVTRPQHIHYLPARVDAAYRRLRRPTGSPKGRPGLRAVAPTTEKVAVST